MTSDLSSLKALAFGDLERELTVTRAVLERLPEQHYEWKPHEKSMTLGRLALHVAGLPEWMRDTIGQDVLDVASAPRPPAVLKDRAELLGRFDRNVATLREAIARFNVENLNHPWTLRNGSQDIVSRPRGMVYRVWCLNHLIHHRGQLCLYLRLLNVPVPTIYFNTADDPTMVFE
jgi:uncharacterized damage-inducible protein DinB